MYIKLLYAVAIISLPLSAQAKNPSFVGDLVARDLIGMGPIGIDTDLFMSNHTRKSIEQQANTKYVSDIIHNLDNPDDNLVVTASYQYLTQLLINSDLSFFSDASKQMFKKHLDNKKMMISRNQSLLYTSSYYKFKAALDAKDPQEISTLSYSYLQSLDPEIAVEQLVVKKN